MKEKWPRIGTKKRAGIVAPLFSLYSKNSAGIGDFSDLKLLVDWASQAGFSIIQLLPMNETGAVSCPYDSVSSFALEPAYFALESATKRLPSGYVDYSIKNEKVGLLWREFLQKGQSEAVAFKKFKADNAYWLSDFALYKALKDFHRGAAWFDWQEEFKNRDKRALEDFKNSHLKEIDFQIWAQWKIFEQFKAVKEYANAKGIFLKGDLPILVSRDSADTWQYPEFFKLEFAAGAPADMYCARGQRWGMPTYNWEKIAQDGYEYVKEKLRYAENFYDILRIDHVVGLFRIWSIPFNEPQENKGLNGKFDPADENLWREHGKNLLNIININTRMLLCAEDLGIIPKSCVETLNELGIPGNDVQRWVKDWNVRHDFLNPAEYRALSVAMLSTHDTTNWAAWWENEAGTVDEALFVRKCAERGVDYDFVKDKLFDIFLSCHGRLRWLNSVFSLDIFVEILNKGQSPAGTVPKEQLWEFIEMYQNTFQEKEKLWKVMGLSGVMREECDSEIIRAGLKLTLGSQAIFCIELITDWLMLAGVFKGDPYQYRINTPGTVNQKNWSLRLPLSLEELLAHPVNQQIRQMIAASGRLYSL